MKEIHHTLSPLFSFKRKAAYVLKENCLFPFFCCCPSLTMTSATYYHTGTKLALLQVVAQPVVPLAFGLSLLGLGLYFYTCIHTGLAKTEKQISWLLTFASSVVCTAISLPYYVRFWRSGWDMQLLGLDSSVHTSLVCFFITYLVMDLTLGSMYYKSRITIATGWIHHSIYIVILFWLMRSRSSSFFTVNAILELPTVILAVGSMRASWRSDFLFALSFFALRLVYHAWMITSVKQHHRIESLWLVAVLVFPLHVYWFYGIVQLQWKHLKIAIFGPPEDACEKLAQEDVALSKAAALAVYHSQQCYHRVGNQSI
jgi:hypothetical protein